MGFLVVLKANSLCCIYHSAFSNRIFPYHDKEIGIAAKIPSGLKSLTDFWILASSYKLSLWTWSTTALKIQGTLSNFWIYNLHLIIISSWSKRKLLNSCFSCLEEHKAKVYSEMALPKESSVSPNPMMAFLPSMTEVSISLRRHRGYCWHYNGYNHEWTDDTTVQRRLYSLVLLNFIFFASI